MQEQPSSAPAVEVRRSGDRLRSRSPLWSTAHSFSAGRHYDPANTSFGALVAYDEHLLPPGGGFAEHAHRDLEIVTWVLEGALRHEDDTNGAQVLQPGTVQVLSAGSGVRHAERALPDAPARFVQMWLLPDERGTVPVYRTAPVPPDAAAGRLVPLAPGTGHDGALPLQVDATLFLARLEPGQAVELPTAPRLHVYVTRGDVHLDAAGRLGAGDAARLTGTGADVTARVPSELLVWELRGPTP